MPESQQADHRSESQNVGLHDSSSGPVQPTDIVPPEAQAPQGEGWIVSYYQQRT